MKPLFAAYSFAIICGSISARAEESPPDPAPVMDPSTLSVDSIACGDHMAYPELAVRRGAEGVSAIEVEVAGDGRLTPLLIARRSGSTREHATLDKAAFRHFAACRLPPPPAGQTVRTVLFYSWKLE